MSLGPGTLLGPYEILGLIGAGGMGEVYRAHDTRLDRDVAIKVLARNLSSCSAALARFEWEAKAIAALSHPAILAIHDFATHEGTSYAVTELLAGQTLREWLAAGALPVRWALEYVVQVAILRIVQHVTSRKLAIGAVATVLLILLAAGVICSPSGVNPHRSTPSPFCLSRTRAAIRRRSIFRMAVLRS